nr:class I SAM-dependent methyltransferase [Legionella israelensis]
MSMIKDSIAVSYTNEKLRDKAIRLANKHSLPLDDEHKISLLVSEERLSLKIKGFSPLYADFNLPFWQKRCLEGKRRALVRACKPKPGMHIIDTTAGWGQDAALLACFGAEVLMLERHPVMAALLEDALQRQDEKSQASLRLALLPVDARDYLFSLKKSDFPDVIYIDPMHPIRQKSALVKKNMQALQQFIGTDEDALELLRIARKKVKQRVVVKWPQKQAGLLPADASIEGKTVRFDLYFPEQA